MLNQVEVRDPGTTMAPGTKPAAMGGADGQVIIGNLHGKHYHNTVAGNVYWASTDGAGVVVSIYTDATFAGFVLWNPTGSGKYISVIRVNLGVTAAGATAESGHGYSWQRGGDHIATAAPMSAFTKLTTDLRGSCLLTETGGKGNSIAEVGEACTFTNAMSNYRQASFGAGKSNDAVSILDTSTEDFDGTMVIPPGVVWTVGSGILTGQTAQISAVWEEIPV